MPANGSRTVEANRFSAYMVIKPVLISIFYGLLIAYVLYPIQKRVVKKIKNPTQIPKKQQTFNLYLYPFYSIFSSFLLLFS
jgi:predicted PurR-regulated permease PerM